MELHLIDTANFYADGGAMFGAIPKSAWSRRYPSNDENQCVLTTRSALVVTDCGHVILIDNGAGSKHPKALSSYRFFNRKDLKEELRKMGVTPESVTDVVLTHLHFDHCGDTVERVVNDKKELEDRLSFPNATHWVSKAQWENFIRPNALEKDSYFQEDMQMVEAESRLRLIDQDAQLCDAVGLKLFDGHTPGQIVAYIDLPEQTYVFAGDVVPLSPNISPKWISAYDIEPLKSYNEKIRLLNEAAEKNQILIYCHDAYTAYSGVKKIKDFFVKTVNSGEKPAPRISL